MVVDDTQGGSGNRGRGSHVVDEAKALELTYTFALTYSSTFNVVGAAIVFGIFSLLIILDATPFMSPTWGVLSVAYFITVLTVLYFYLRAIMYNFVAVEVARRLGFLELAEKVYAETPEAKGLLQRKMAGSFIPYGPYTRAYFILGPLVLVVLWIVVAVL